MDASLYGYDIMIILLIAEVGKPRLYTFLTVAATVFVCLLICFPFYIYFNKVNKKRDEEAALFNFSNHFYRIVKKMYVLYVLLSLCLYLVYKDGFQTALYTTALMLVSALIFVILFVIIESFYLLTSVLAIFNFVLHITPAADSFIQKAQNIVHKWVSLIYILFFLKEIWSIVSYIRCFISVCTIEDKTYISSKYMNLYACFCVFHIISSFLYVFILIHNYKLKAKDGIQQTKPGKHIIWVAIFTMLLRVVLIPFAFYLYKHKFPIYLIGVIVISIDITIVPLIIQLTYFGCNRRNVTALVKIFLCCKRKPTTIQPHYQSSGSLETA